jgi:hypothetical protein
VNAEKNRIKLMPAVLLAVILASTAVAQSAAGLVRSGNQLYKSGDYKGAIEKYEQALSEKPAAARPQFDKANSLYQLKDLPGAMDLYRQVAAESKDMKMVTKAKYNLGNCHFNQGAAQADSNVKKAIDEMKTAIGYWRDVLDIEPDNEKAARNIEVARLTIKDLLDRQKNKSEPNRPSDANNPQQQNKQKQQQQPAEPNQASQQKQQQGQSGEPNEPNQAEQQQQQTQAGEPNETDRQHKQAQKAAEPNETQQQQAQQQQQQKAEAPDATVQQILDREQRQRQQRQLMQALRYKKVDKDW